MRVSLLLQAVACWMLAESVMAQAAARSWMMIEVVMRQAAVETLPTIMEAVIQVAARK
jgi:hypothetical protein